MYTRISLEIILLVLSRLDYPPLWREEESGWVDACDSSIMYSLEQGFIKKEKEKEKKNERKWRKYDETKPILRRVMQPGFVSRAFSFPFRNEFDGARFLFFLLLFLFTTNLLLYLTILFILLYFVRNLILYNLILNIYIEKNILRNFFRIKINKLISSWLFKLFTRFSIFIDLDFF